MTVTGNVGNMTVADMKAAVALAVEQAMRLIQTDDAPVAVAEPPKPARKGRTLTDEQKRKMAEGRKRAAAAKAAPAAKPKAAKPAAKVAAVKAEKPDRLHGWDVTPHTTARGVSGKIVRVGPFSMFLADDDADKRAAAIEAINKVFRTTEIHKVAAKF